MATNLASKNFTIPTILNVDGGGETAFQRPFDINIFSSGNCSVAAGTINNVVPSNMFNNFSFDANAINYCKISATAAGGQISSASISIDTTAPASPSVLQGGPPTTMNLLFGIISGSAFRTIGDSNFTVNSVESYKVPKTVAVGELPYDIYYTWEVITS